MKIAVSTYSFQRLINAGGMSQLDCIRQAREMGFDGVEIMELFPPEGMEREEYAGRIASLCRSLDFPVVNYTVSADFLAGSGKNPEAEAIRLQRQVNIAAILGAAGLRHDAAWGIPEGSGFRGFEEALPVLIEGCRRVTDYAASKGIRTMVENHGTFCQESRRMERLVNGVAHPNFGLLVDMGNFLCADEPPEEAVGRLAPYALYVHAKDFLLKSGREGGPGPEFLRTRAGNYLRGTVIGHGVVPVAQCLSSLKMAGYDGYVGVEFEGMEEPLEAIACGLRNLRRCLAWI